MSSRPSGDRGSAPRDWGDDRDRIQVGAFFGLVAGVGVLALVMLWMVGARVLGRPADIAGMLRIHLVCALGYVACGAAIGGLWPLRRAVWGYWALWLIATAMLSVTLTCVAHGALSQWPPAAWPRIALMAPGLAWVLGSSRRRPATPA